MENPTRLRLLVSLFLGAALIAGAAVLFVRLDSHAGLEIVLPTPTSEASEIKVYVSGAVNQPGVYALKPGDRLDDALRAAGGPSADADLLALNLAVRLHDEQQVIVPTRTAGAQPSSASTDATPSATTLIDINTASAQALDSLPGIGPELAAAIVRYREEHGPFPDVESLIAVPGIGPKRMADVRPLIVAR